MIQRFLTLAVALGCVASALTPTSAGAAATSTIWLTLKGAGLKIPNHEYQLNNYTQSGKTFTATTALDGSSAPLLTLTNNNREIDEILVRTDGQTIDTASHYTLCVLKSDNLGASGTSQTQRLSFICQKEYTSVTVVPTPSPAPVLHVIEAKPLVTHP